nr:hypothetical protein [Spirochaeta sp.]
VMSLTFRDSHKPGRAPTPGIRPRSHHHAPVRVAPSPARPLAHHNNPIYSVVVDIDPPGSSPELRAAKALLDDGPIAVVVVEKGRISYANPAASQLAADIGITGAIPGQPVSVFGFDIALIDDSIPGNGIETTIGNGGGPGTAAKPVIIRTVTDVSDAKSRVLLIEDLSRSKALDDALRERTATLEAAIESFPFDFWMNNLQNRTILQNSISRRLWGEQHGAHMQDVQDDPEILAQWMEVNKAALAGETQTGETAYQVDGEDRIFRNIVAPVRDGDTVIGVFGANIDITELKHALRDRDLLLRELNHRVKNHLQVILSIISLQRDPCPEKTGNTFRQIQERIQAVLLVHEQLYGTDNLHTIDLGEYTSQLIAAVRSGHGSPLDYHPFSAPVPIEYHHAVPYGIALTELIHNAINHGIPAAPIVIETHHDPAQILITVENAVEDSGETAASHPRGETPPTDGGLMIVASVVSQFSGELSSTSEKGRYRATLRIPYPLGSPTEMLY